MSFFRWEARRFALPRGERDASEIERERILILSTEEAVGWLALGQVATRMFLLYEHFFYGTESVMGGVLG